MNKSYNSFISDEEDELMSIYGITPLQVDICKELMDY